uniref:Uncharacterized protein n=1 Tax=Arundo donax TaxID=35708 RepID=A0A0A8ZF99_ARUDO
MLDESAHVTLDVLNNEHVVGLIDRRHILGVRSVPLVDP